MMMNCWEAKLLDIVDGRTKRDDLSNRWCARLEFCGEIRPGRGFASHARDHVPAEKQRVHRLQKLTPTVKHTHAAGTINLVSREPQKVRTELEDIGRKMRDTLRGINHHQGTDIMRPACDLTEWRSRTKHIRHRRDRDQSSSSRQEFVELVEVELAVRSERQKATRCANLLGKLLPGNQVGMVFDDA